MHTYHILCYCNAVIISFNCLAGTNGGVSVAGTLSSAVGGSIVGLAYYVIVLVCGREAVIGVSIPPQWPLIIFTTLTGLLGSLIDSFLGATLQYSGQYWFLSV